MTSSIPWQQRLSTGTEDIQDEVIRWYQQTRHGKAFVPTMIWGTLQTEAYATVPDKLSRHFNDQWQVLLTLRTSELIERAHVGQLQDHTHRMGLLLAAHAPK